MSPAHVVCIVAAIVSVLLCGLHPTCTTMEPTVADLAKMIVAGVLGNAMGRMHIGRDGMTSSPPMSAVAIAPPAPAPTPKGLP